MGMEFTPEDSLEWMRRARQFLASARDNLEKNRTEVAAFECEQAVQLALKARLFQLEEIIPRTRSIRELLRRLALLTGNSTINDFIEDNLPLIRLLEESHDKARYSIQAFPKTTAQKCVIIAEKVLDFVMNSTTS